MAKVEPPVSDLYVGNQSALFYLDRVEAIPSSSQHGPANLVDVR
jgi:hypothetical protein